jgi:hypothetical protein
MAKGGFSRTAIAEMQDWLQKHHTEVHEVMKLGVQICVCKNLNATMKKHPTMVWESQTDGYLL